MGAPSLTSRLVLIVPQALKLIMFANILVALSLPLVAQGEVISDSHRFEPDNIRASQFAKLVQFNGTSLFIDSPSEWASAPESGAIFQRSWRHGMLTSIAEYAPEPIMNLSLATSMDVRDGILLAGARRFPQAPPFEGRAYVWRLDDGAYQPDGIISAPDSSPDSEFGGASCVIDSTTIAIGRPGHITPGNELGEIVFYTRAPSGWTVTQRLNTDGVAPNGAGFGAHLAYSQGHMVVGDTIRQAHMLRRDPATGTFEYVEQLVDPRAGFTSDFGHAVAIEGDLVAVSDPRKGFLTSVGQVHLYRRTGSTWPLEASLEASDSFTQLFSNGNVINDSFGESVAISDGRVAVGCPNSRRGAPLPATLADLDGAAYIFEESGSTWQERFQARPTTEYQAECLGDSIALDGDRLVVGAPFARTAQGWRTGAMEIFSLPFGLQVCSGQPNSTGFGATAALVGDRKVDLNDLRVVSDNLPLGSFALLIGSTQTGFVANPGGSMGNLCLSGQVSRFNSTVTNAGASGTVSFVVDVDHVPTPASGPIAITAGSTFVFQAWYRDVAASGVSVSNFTAAVELQAL